MTAQAHADHLLHYQRMDKELTCAPVHTLLEKQSVTSGDHQIWIDGGKAQDIQDTYHLPKDWLTHCNYEIKK